jgi:hypothetical protein
MQEQLEELAQTLSNNQLSHFILDQKEGVQSEIEVDGMMYDVIRYEEDGQSIHYWCIQDFAENMMAKEDSSSIEILQNAHHKWSNHIKYLVKKNITLFLSDPMVPIDASRQKGYSQTHFKNKFSEKSTSINLPPPQHLV